MEVNIYCNLWNNFNLIAVSRKKLRNLTVSRQNWKNVTVNRQSSSPSLKLSCDAFCAGGPEFDPQIWPQMPPFFPFRVAFNTRKTER